MDLNKIKAFYHSAKAGSIANSGLPLSSSVISRHISELEDELDTKLLLRSPKGMTLTADGKVFFNQCQKILQEVQATYDLMAAQRKDPRDYLTVHVPTFWASTVLVNYLADFLTQYPGMRLNIRADDKEPDFFAEEHTVAILPYCPQDDRLIRRFLMNFHLELFAHPQYLEQHGIPKTVEDLNQHQLIASSKRNMAFQDIDWHLKIGVSDEQVREPYIRTNDMHLAAANGLGIASLARENHFLRESGLVRVLPELQGPVLNAYYLYSERIKDLRPVKLFSDFIVEILRKTNKLTG